MTKLPLLLTLSGHSSIPTALANAGTPLMWASMFHMVFGNAIIGVGEGLLLARTYSCSKRRCVFILILANYLSAWIGYSLLVAPLVAIPDLSIENIRLWFLLFVFAAFLLTLLIELPFFWMAVRLRKLSFIRVLTATLLIHSVSYSLLFCWSWLVSRTSMMTRLEVVSADELDIPESYDLYFISRDGHHVLRVPLNSLASPEEILPVTAHDRNDRLAARSRDDSGFDLVIHLASDEIEKQEEKLLIESFSDRAPIEPKYSEGYSHHWLGTWSSFGSVPSIASRPEWEFRTGFWAAEGITATMSSSGREVHFSLETPFAAWATRNAVHLEGDFVLFQLGADQVCVLHPGTRKIALVARGKGPIAALSRSPDAPGH